MIRHTKPFRALLESLEGFGLAKEITTALLHALCASFAENEK